MTSGDMTTARNSKGRRGDYLFRDELYEAAISVDASIRRIHAAERNLAGIGLDYSECPKELFQLKGDMIRLLEKFSRQVDPDTQKSICGMQSKVQDWINKAPQLKISGTKGNKGRSRQGHVDEGEGGSRQRDIPSHRSVKISEELKNRLFSSIEMQFNDVDPLGAIWRPVGRSVERMIDDMFAEERTLLVDVAGGFKYGLFSGQLDELWDCMRQLDSPESKFLAICMLSCDSFVHCCATLKFISSVINKLGDWVPELALAMKSVEEDVPKVAEDEDSDEDVDVDEYEEQKKAEAYYFAAYRRSWERVYGKGCSFEDPTIFSSMHFTHYMPGHTGQTPMGARYLRTMEIYSIRITETEGFALEWPLEVYGVVAARDMVDYRRNLLFLRPRDDCQILTKENPFLHLTGPSRAIMSGDTVTIEADLMLKGTVRSKDRVLITKAFPSHGDNYGDRRDTLLLRGLCTMELQCEHLEQSVQATILSVCVVHGSLPCENGIVCYALVGDKTEGVSLLDSQAGKMPIDEEGNLELSRQVVSVKSGGGLNIVIKALSARGEVSGSVAFIAQCSNVSQESCSLGGCEVEITVAWSLLIESQHIIELKGSAEPYEHELNPSTPRMKLEEDAC